MPPARSTALSGWWRSSSRLFLHGRSDHIAPVALAEQMHARIPNSRLVLFEGGHLFTFTTQREKFVVDVDAFLTPGG